MATTYTAKLYEGERQSFRDFVLTCAREFGACVMQRGDPMRDYPKLQELSNYHSKSLDDYKKKLKILESMTDQEAKCREEQERVDFIKQRIESDEKSLKLLYRYQAMLDKVKNWEPPTKDHQGLKDFMIQQLTDSIEWDCSTGYPQTQEIISGEEWKRRQIEHVLKNIDYHTREDIREKEMVDQRNRWIQALYDSLEIDNER